MGIYLLTLPKKLFDPQDKTTDCIKIDIRYQASNILGCHSLAVGSLECVNIRAFKGNPAITHYSLLEATAGKIKTSKMGDNVMYINYADKWKEDEIRKILLEEVYRQLYDHFINSHRAALWFMSDNINNNKNGNAFLIKMHGVVNKCIEKGWLVVASPIVSNQNYRQNYQSFCQGWMLISPDDLRYVGVGSEYMHIPAKAAKFAEVATKHVWLQGAKQELFDRYEIPAAMEQVLRPKLFGNTTT